MIVTKIDAFLLRLGISLSSIGVASWDQPALFRKKTDRDTDKKYSNHGTGSFLNRGKHPPWVLSQGMTPSRPFQKERIHCGESTAEFHMLDLLVSLACDVIICSLTTISNDLELCRKQKER